VTNVYSVWKLCKRPSPEEFDVQYFPAHPAAHGSQVTALLANLRRRLNCWNISLSIVDCQFPLCSVGVTTESRELLWWAVLKKILYFRVGVRV